MHCIGRKFIAILAICCINNSVLSQNSDFSDTVAYKKEMNDSTSKLQIRKIIITGNKKTKSYIILREMQVKPGDSIIISQIPTALETARSFIYNTTLFVEVSVSPVIINANDFDIVVDVVERWYIFPIPVFQLADRSYNEWIEKYNASLDRVSYGIRFYHKNASGRNDQFSISLINGFTRNISFNYKAPYSNPSLTEGVSVEGGFSQTREIPFLTSNKNNIIYFKNDDFVKNEWFVNAAYISRKGLKKRETFTVGFRHIKVDDSIISPLYNPAFFNSDKAIQSFPELEYKLQFINVDNILYPLKGYTASFIINKRGLQWKNNINRLSVRAAYNLYFNYPGKWYSSFRFSGEIKLPFTQPYINRRALGYKDDYLRGDEYFVVDGVASGLTKFDLKKEVIKFYLPTFLKSKTYNRLPFTVYAKTFADMGYAYIQPEFDTKLNNRLLYSGGFGIDILTLYDFKLSLEYSFNQLGQKGLFLHN
ncbi:MAG: POTRA domain-containing protein [Ginsengibacter sp.]